jgi:hypothetical protein
MKAMSSSEMMITTYNAARRHKSEEHNPSFHRRENFNYHIVIVFDNRLLKRIFGHKTENIVAKLRKFSKLGPS